MSLLIAIDPGRKKCGMVLASTEIKSVLRAKVVRTNSVNRLIKLWNQMNDIDSIIIGNGTNSQSLSNEIKLNNYISFYTVEEKNTTLRARDRYWEIWPKNFLLNLIPNGMIVPQTNLDALAALVLLEDFLHYKLTWLEKNDFKIWP